MRENAKLVQVHVRFAASGKGPFHQGLDPLTTVEQVLAVVLAYFEIVSDGMTRYYLKMDGGELSGTDTIGQLATNPGGQTASLQMRLITETISG